MRSLVLRVVADVMAVAFKRISRSASFGRLSHLLGRISRRYYWEDFVRVYPDPRSEYDVRNFLNHRKFYAFAAQFARGAKVVDVGCGTGYGCALLRDAGAASVMGADASKHAIRFAKQQYGDRATFIVQGMTDMRECSDGQFDLTICSEVLEHIKEYGKQNQALAEMKRITRLGGIIVIGTPNSELLGDHGFHFDEMNALMKDHFAEFCIFENALVPFGPARELWERRCAARQVGVVVTQHIKLDETVLMHGQVPELKSGAAAGIHRLGRLDVDTTLLHNTHSWAIIAIRDAIPARRS